MAKKIDWMYDRKSCETCKKTRGFLEGAGTKVADTVEATKNRVGPEEALKLLDGLTKIVASKGKKVVEFDLKKDRPGDDELLAHLIGPTGNLRAPTAIVGKTLLVGFNEDAYKAVLGL
jgi:arsenate reductase-like glutaredoxin family protein